MAIEWEPDESKAVAAAVSRHPISSGRCAALARAVFVVGKARDPHATGRHITPKGAARFVVPKVPNPPCWASHTLAQVEDHAVDAITGVPGYDFGNYLADHWEYPEALKMVECNVFEIDVGIQEAE